MFIGRHIRTEQSYMYIYLLSSIPNNIMDLLPHQRAILSSCSFSNFSHFPISFRWFLLSVLCSTWRDTHFPISFSNFFPLLSAGRALQHMARHHIVVVNIMFLTLFSPKLNEIGRPTFGRPEKKIPNNNTVCLDPEHGKSWQNISMENHSNLHRISTKVINHMV